MATGTDRTARAGLAQTSLELPVARIPKISPLLRTAEGRLTTAWGWASAVAQRDGGIQPGGAQGREPGCGEGHGRQ